MFRTVLVPVDFSPTSLQAVQHAGQVVRAVGGWLHLLHVLERGDPEQAQVWLQELASSSRRPPRLMLERPGEASVSETILRVARRAGADLLILGPHGGQGLSERRLGSVTQHLLLYSHIPVHLVPEALEPSSREGNWSKVVSGD